MKIEVTIHSVEKPRVKLEPLEGWYRLHLGDLTVNIFNEPFLEELRACFQTSEQTPEPPPLEFAPEDAQPIEEADLDTIYDSVLGIDHEVESEEEQADRWVDQKREDEAE